MIHNEYMFLKTLEDLKEKVSGENFEPYKLIRACGLLRHLILDGSNSLVYIMNRKHKLKLLFKVRMPEEGTLYSSLMPFGDGFQEITDKELFQIKPLKNDGIGFTVKEIVKHVAYVLGGVHSGAPNDTDKLILAMTDPVGINAFAKYACIMSICDVIIEGLKPLEEKVKTASP